MYYVWCGTAAAVCPARQRESGELAATSRRMAYVK